MTDRSFLVTEPAHAWPLSLLLGFSAMLPIAASVRRGVSFRTPGGPRVAQIATMLWLFRLGVGALATLPLEVARVLLLVGYVSLAVLDPLAARRGEAPLFFARLRPVKMAIPIVSVLAIMAHDLLRNGIMT